jgi:hypothetical protein
MSEKKAILGTTMLEWRSARETPMMHIEEYDGECWLQSEQLLLADVNGKITVGYCQQSSGERAEFESVCTQTLGEICLWSLLPKPPIESLEQG